MARTRSTRAGTFSKLLADYQREHAEQQRRLHGYDAAHLERAFGRAHLHELTDQKIIDYGLARQAKGASTECINEELRSLSWVLRWAGKTSRLVSVPQIWFVREHPASRPATSLALSGEEWRRRFGPRVAQEKDLSKKKEEEPTKWKLTPDALQAHIKAHALRYNSEGHVLPSPERRRELLLKEQGIHISRDRLSRRLNELKGR